MKSKDIIIQYQSVVKEKKPYDYYRYKGIFQELVHFVNVVDVKIYCIVRMVICEVICWKDTYLKNNEIEKAWMYRYIFFHNVLYMK